MDKVQVKIEAISSDTVTTIKVGQHNLIMDAGTQMGGKNKGINPMEALLSALAACENITAVNIAQEMNFDLQGIDFNITGELDSRGAMGDPNVRTYFEKVTVLETVKTIESEDRIKELQKAVETRCPTYGLLKAADVTMIDHWVKA